MRINIMKFAHQQLIKDSYDDADVDAKAMYVYPGGRVPDWLEYRTRENYMTIDLSSAPPSIGFIFCFIVPKVRSRYDNFTFTISDGDNQNDSSTVFTKVKPSSKMDPCL